MLARRSLKEAVKQQGDYRRAKRLVLFCGEGRLRVGEWQEERCNTKRKCKQDMQRANGRMFIVHVSFQSFPGGWWGS